MEAQTLGALAAIVNEAIAKAVGPLQAKIMELEGRPVYDPQPHAEESAAMLRSISQINERIDTVAAPYGDSGLVDRLSKQLEALREQIPAAYDDAWARQTFDAVVKQLDRVKPYDDTGLRAEVAEVRGHVKAAEKMAETHAGLIHSLDDNAVQIGDRLKELESKPTPADGRDALQLEVLPAIDEQKSYTRGTYAKHAGGLWRAFEQTSGMRGWECIVDGVASLTAEMHGKSLVVRAIQSSGTEAILHATLPVQTYKGVFAQGSDYEVGDTATWGGSVWHCNVTGTKALPGDGSKDWTQAVKKGRDYREPVKTERSQGPVKL